MISFFLCFCEFSFKEFAYFKYVEFIDIKLSLVSEIVILLHHHYLSVFLLIPVINKNIFISVGKDLS